MALSKLGDFIEQVDIRNENNVFGAESLRGISINKILIPTKADTSNLNLKPYKIVRHNWFTYCSVTSRNGNKISLAYNDSEDCIVSSINPVFKVKDESKLLSRYLMMFFNRSEFDRYARFNSWGSARETFSWEDFCDIELEVPPIEIQKKYVAIYEGLLANLRSYEKGLDDLKLVCDGYIEELRKKYKPEEIGKYLASYSEKNKNNSIADVVGLSTAKEFRVAQSRVNRNELGGYKIVHPYNFAYVPTTDTWKVLAFAVNHFDKDVVVSPVYEVFSVDNNKIIPDYLALWMKRKEFDRHVRFNSWGSARENFTFEEMCNVKIPIPPVETQNKIVDVFQNLKKRTGYLATLKHQISSICPILIRGAILDAQGGN